MEPRGYGLNCRPLTDVGKASKRVQSPIILTKESNMIVDSVSDYHNKALRTLKEATNVKELRLHAALGLSGESAELLEVLEGDHDSIPAYLDKAVIELGDIMWYLPALCLSLHTTMEELATRSTKLQYQMTAVNGLVIHSGKILDAVKKEYIYGKAIDRDSLLDHATMVFNHAIAVCPQLETNIMTVLTKNIAKLAVRYPEKYSDDLAINKNEEAENAIANNAA